jgi:hypothetical protein
MADTRTERISTTAHTTIQSLYEETNIMIENGGRRSQKIILINQGVRQGCPLLPVLFNLYLDHVMREWQDSSLLQTNILATILFADDQVIMTVSEDSLQKLISNCLKLPQHLIYLYS